MDRLFTRDEAEALLPQIVPVLERLRGLAESLEALQQELAQLHVRARGNGKDSHGDEMERKQAACDDIQQRIRQEAGHIQQLGVEVKDLRTGLIDFPSLRDGQVVYLCWKLGEAGIQFWHQVDTGYAGRQPL